MNFSLFQTSQPSDKAFGNRFLFSLLTFAFLLTAAILGWFVWHSFHASRTESEIQERMIKMAEFRGSAVQIKEILTNSAKMSAQTGNRFWETKYSEYEPLLDNALRTVKTFAPNPQIADYVAQIDDAHRNLNRIHQQAFDHARDGRLAEADSILASREYEIAERLFDKNIMFFESAAKEYENSQINESKDENNLSVVAIIVLFVVSVWAWTATIYDLQKSRKALLDNIAGRKRAGAALDKSEARFRELFDNASDIVFTTDLDGRFTSLNKEGEKLTGYGREEIRELKIGDLVAADRLKSIANLQIERIEPGDSISYETDIIAKNEDRLTVEVNCRAIYEDNRPIGMQGIARDVTERRRMAKALEKSEQYRNLFKHASDAILVIEPETETVLNVNDKACELYGIAYEDFIGLSLKSVSKYGEEDRPLSELAENGTYPEFETVQYRGDGTPLYLLINASIIEYEGKPAILSVNHDITVRKQTEDALLRSQSALDATRDGALMFSPETLRFFYANKGAIEQTGYSRHELLRMTPLDLRPNLTEKRFRTMLDRLIDGTYDSYSLTTSFVRRDETKIPVEVILQYVASESGDDLFVAMVRDITERKQAQDVVQKNLSLLTSTFEATADGILVVDLENRIVTYNRKFLEIFQIPDDIINSRDSEKNVNFVLSQLENPENFIETTKRLTASPETKSYDLLRLKNGKTFERYSCPQTTGSRVIGRVISFRDITERVQAEKSLQESQQQYQQLFDRNPHPIWVYDLETLEFLAVNDKAAEHYGYTRDEFLAMNVRDIRPPEDVPVLMDAVAEVAASGGGIKTHSVRHQKKDGTIIDVEVTAQPISFVRKQARLALASDVTDRRRADAALRESEYKLRTLLESMSEGLLEVDNEDRIVFVNNCLCEMVGYAQDELIGSDWSRLLIGEDTDFVKRINERRRKGFSDRYEVRLKTKSGAAIWVLVGGAPVVNARDEVIGSMGIFTDITERKRAEEKLRHDALHDGLTGLANRTLFANHLQKAIERGKRSNNVLYAVLFLDFDRFKVINDSLGHAAGDDLLKQIARRLENSLRTADLLARLGGDEFTILLNELADGNDAIQVAERIQKDLNAPFMLGEQEIFMSASIGIALCSAGHHRAEDMLRDADIAMYRAKAKGKAQYQVFDQTMHKSAISKLQLETEMHHALQRGEFCLSYQPIVSLETDDLMGFEALIRWNHPERSIVSPNEFIAAAEENGLIIPLGRWILYESCRQLREWQNNYSQADSLSISVNLSTKQFSQFDLYEQVAGALISTQLDPRCLKLEITESQVMENSDKAVSMMNRLRETGVQISLDDFGTGYSSLSYLHRLPINYLKIDRSFVSRMVESRENGEIVHTIVKLAQNLKMKVVAEGIENADQFAHLKQLGCEYGQGYYISKPLAPEAAEAFIDSRLKKTQMITNQPFVNAELNM